MVVYFIHVSSLFRWQTSQFDNFTFGSEAPVPLRPGWLQCVCRIGEFFQPVEPCFSRNARVEWHDSATTTTDHTTTTANRTPAAAATTNRLHHCHVRFTRVIHLRFSARSYEFLIYFQTNRNVSLTFGSTHFHIVSSADGWTTCSCLPTWTTSTSRICSTCLSCKNSPWKICRRWRLARPTATKSGVLWSSSATRIASLRHRRSCRDRAATRPQCQCSPTPATVPATTRWPATRSNTPSRSRRTTTTTVVLNPRKNSEQPLWVDPFP